MKEGYHMSNKFTRNITKVKDIKKQGLDTNNPNDLISLTDNKTVYLRREKDYHCLTDNVKSIKINSTEFLADENNHVTTQKLVEKVDKYSPNENGFISTDYPLSVNGQTIDNKTNRNIEIDTGVLTVNGQEPDETGNVVFESFNKPPILNVTSISQEGTLFYDDVNKRGTLDYTMYLFLENNFQKNDLTRLKGGNVTIRFMGIDDNGYDTDLIDIQKCFVDISLIGANVIKLKYNVNDILYNENNIKNIRILKQRSYLEEIGNNTYVVSLYDSHTNVLLFSYNLFIGDMKSFVPS